MQLCKWDIVLFAKDLRFCSIILGNDRFDDYSSWVVGTFFNLSKSEIFFLFLLCQLDLMWWAKFKRLMNWIYKDKDTILTIFNDQTPQIPQKGKLQAHFIKKKYPMIHIKILRIPPAVPFILQSPIYSILISFPNIINSIPAIIEIIFDLTINYNKHMGNEQCNECQ